MNVQIILFGVLVLIDVVLFHWGVFTLALARGETIKMQKGRRVLLIALVLLIILLAFYLVGYFFKTGEQSSPEPIGGFPPALHISPFPPAPESAAVEKENTQE